MAGAASQAGDADSSLAPVLHIRVFYPFHLLLYLLYYVT